MAAKKSWSAKLAAKREPEVKVLTKPFAGLTPGTRMLVSSPEEIDTWVRSIPPGETRSIDELKRELSARHGADAACPASTMIFLRVAAEAAWEALEAGAALDEVTPFWRIIEPDSKVASRLSCDMEFIRIQRAIEQRR